MPLLSRFAGAAQQLGIDDRGAVMVNPYSPDDISDAIRTALDMPLNERQARYETMIGTIREDNIQSWTNQFCADLDA
jgi:trehalose 6-phosphate synthase